jgi:hypothetical protein
MSSKRHSPLNTPRMGSSPWPSPLPQGSTPGTNAKTVPASSLATGSQTPRPILKHRSMHSCDDCQSPPTLFPVESVKTAVQFAEDSFSPSVTTASPQIVPWPVDHPPWLPLRTNDGELHAFRPMRRIVFRDPWYPGPRTPYMVPQQTYLDTLNLPASQGTPRLRPAADHPPTPFNHDHSASDVLPPSSDTNLYCRHELI